jgi:ABC-type branched-subunit amino acid transport system ATPase component
VLRAFPELLRPLADYLELIFCVLVVGTLTFFPDGLMAAVAKSFRRKKTAAPKIAGVDHADQRERIARLLSATEALGESFGVTTMDSGAPILEIRSVSKSYEGLRDVDDVSVELKSHSLHGLMCPNGAGKTTMFNMVTGFVRPDKGEILLANQSVADIALEQRVKKGMTRTFQHASVFPQLSCLDNVLIGLGRNTIRQGSLRSVAAALDAQSIALERRAGLSALDAVGLAGRAQDQAATLSLGDQRRLEIARAVVSRPRIILFDEPVSGVSRDEAERLRELLLALNGELGIAMVVIEHNIGFLVSLCSRVSVMVGGRILAEGEANEIVADPRVRQAYFGEREAAA